MFLTLLYVTKSRILKKNIDVVPDPNTAQGLTTRFRHTTVESCIPFIRLKLGEDRVDYYLYPRRSYLDRVNVGRISYITVV